MLCPKCKHATKVKDTRGTMRRRSCMNIECGHGFVTDEVLTERPMPRTTAEANKLSMEKEFSTDSTVKALRKQIARLEIALEAATDAPTREPKPAVNNPQPSPAIPVKSRKPASLRVPFRRPAGESRPAAFFSRESLVADIAATPGDEPPAPSPSWVPKLPPAAFGRMR
jgi:hypothetical protein